MNFHKEEFSSIFWLVCMYFESSRNQKWRHRSSRGFLRDNICERWTWKEVGGQGEKSLRPWSRSDKVLHRPVRSKVCLLEESHICLTWSTPCPSALLSHCSATAWEEHILSSKANVYPTLLTAMGSVNCIPYNRVASSFLKGDLRIAPPWLPHPEIEFVN